MEVVFGIKISYVINRCWPFFPALDSNTFNLFAQLEDLKILSQVFLSYFSKKIFTTSFLRILSNIFPCLSKNETCSISFHVNKFNLFRYVWAGLVVLLGISINIYQKNKSKINWILLHIFSVALIKSQTLYPRKQKVLEV